MFNKILRVKACNVCCQDSKLQRVARVPFLTRIYVLYVGSLNFMSEGI